LDLLRRTLRVGALVLVLVSIPLIVVPSAIVETVMGQPPVAEVWVRLLGVAGVVLAMVHVLILRRLDDLWWWCWAFVLFDGLSALIIVLHAAFGVPDGSPAWPWWVYGAGSALFAALYLGGIARAGQEAPIA
jgi:hypothetical protein